MKKAKPFAISKQAVWDAWKRVKANKGAPGIDEEHQVTTSFENSQTFY